MNLARRLSRVLRGGALAGVVLAALPMPLGAQESLVYADPRRFFVPPYVGRRGRIGVRLDGHPNWRAIGDLVTEAYRCVAPRRLAASLVASRHIASGSRT